MSAPQKHAFLAAVGALLVSAAVCHLLVKDSAQLDAAVARVAEVPKDIGDWRAKDEETEERAFEMAGARGYWMRTYVNQRSKDSVLVILMCGRAGKMAVHTPEVCYGGAGFQLREDPTPFALKAEQRDNGHLWTSQFAKKAAVTTRFRLYWGWNSRGPWEAATAPRWQFRGEPFLYKLYVATDSSRESSMTPDPDPTAGFLREFIPVLNGVLFPAESR